MLSQLFQIVESQAIEKLSSANAGQSKLSSAEINAPSITPPRPLILPHCALIGIISQQLLHKLKSFLYDVSVIQISFQVLRGKIARKGITRELFLHSVNEADISIAGELSQTDTVTSPTLHTCEVRFYGPSSLPAGPNGMPESRQQKTDSEATPA